MGDIFYKGLRIKLWKVPCNENNFAGGYSIVRVDMFAEKIIREMSGGQPFDSAYQEAEELAVLTDAELTLNGIIIRKSFKGEYK